ncbi:electron transfer flavoprotein subunit alpha/FixB family protein [Marinicrinis lubricantis]|uniref:Electron transfer flavoprotein subunit alpha/FixB family protein n=1 Tax=Marinicrinis lubricantis TaxID=2086470 RepID=A0ABW1ILD7_9BACL
MSKQILVVAETKAGKLRQVTFEAVHAASRMMQDGDTLSAALIGFNTKGYISAFEGIGIDHLYVADSTELEHYRSDAYFTALQEIVSQVNPDVVIFGHTAAGKDLAPLTAELLQSGQISDVIHMEPDEQKEWLFTRPIYTGKAFETRAFQAYPWVLTVRPNNFPAAVSQSGLGTPELIAVSPDLSRAKSILTGVEQRNTGAKDLSEARIVISGGRGVKSKEGFVPLAELAEVVDGAIGASRGACDAGYCDYSLQIGQTGKVVTPDLYIACGISGAIQHLAGMSQSKVIVAINKDPEAPIFKIADYGIVGDLFEAVPEMIKQLKK